MPRNQNDVGAVWHQRNDRGEYYSVRLELGQLLALLNGETPETVFLNMYESTSENPKAPVYQLRFYPKGGGTRPAGGQREEPPRAAAPPTSQRPPARTPPRRAPRGPDDDIPFIWLLPLISVLSALGLMA